jgi:hypothetical protein
VKGRYKEYLYSGQLSIRTQSKGLEHSIFPWRLFTRRMMNICKRLLVERSSWHQQYATGTSLRVSARVSGSYLLSVGVCSKEKTYEKKDDSSVDTHIDTYNDSNR